jgi:hypothetical protein
MQVLQRFAGSGSERRDAHFSRLVHLKKHQPEDRERKAPLQPSKISTH